jgi:hypothetical protein
MIYLDVDVSENEVFQPNGRTVMADPSQVDSKKNMFFFYQRESVKFAGETSRK